MQRGTVGSLEVLDYLSFTKQENLFSSLLGFTSAFLWNLFFTDGSGALEDTELCALRARGARCAERSHSGVLEEGLNS
jgi:hypothetical protein